MSLIVRTAKKVLGEIQLFSRHVIGMELRQYQLKAVRPVIQSILNHQGEEFYWEFSRQSGKNETLAHLEVYLLNLFQRIGGSIVHTSPTLGQLSSDNIRIGDRLNNNWNRNQWGKMGKVMGVVLRAMRVIFLSGHPQSQPRGWTASVLLVFNEFQDFSKAKAESDFMPMASSTNATRLYIGTPKTSNTALALKKRELLRMEAKDGLQRVFIINWREVAAENPSYGEFVRGEIAKKGERHPSILTEYECEELDAQGGLFDRRRQALMQGQHERHHKPEEGKVYIGVIDVSGEDEGDPLNLENPSRDYTVSWIYEVDFFREHVLGGPTYKAVDAFVDRGSKHFDTGAGNRALNHRLYAWLSHWGVAHVVGDSTGIGAGLMSWLESQFGDHMVTKFQFNRSSKAMLGNNFLSIVETGRFRMYATQDEHTTNTPAGAGFWEQVERCLYEANPELPLEKGLKWAVPDSARYETVDQLGKIVNQLVHDDYLLAAALIAEADRLYQEGELLLSTGESYILPGVDVAQDLGKW